MAKNKVQNRYKSTHFGLIPDDWDLKKIKTIAEVKGGYAFDSKKFRESGKYQIVKMSNLYDNRLDLERSKSFLSNLTAQEKEFLLEKGDILITLTGTVGKQDYGYSYQITDEQHLLLNQRVAKMKSTSVDQKFLYYGIKTKLFLNQFYLAARGGTGNQTNVGTVDLASLYVLTPPPKEQTAIANLLETWDNVINSLIQLISQKELRKRWLMQQLLSGKKRVKNFNAKWKKHHYADLLEVVKRPVRWDDNTVYHLISVRRRSGGIFQRESLRGSQIKVKDLRTANEGDFLFSKMQIVHGASALVSKEYAGSKISGSYIAVVSKDSDTLNMQYFDWYSKTPYFYHQTYISSYGVHIEKMTFDFESFLTLDIYLPSVKEQQAIVDILSTANNEVELLKEKLESIKQQKKGLMQMLLTGKKRLKI